MYTTYMPQKGDFSVDGKCFFEAGGKGKTFDQIKDAPDRYLAVDDVEYVDFPRILLFASDILVTFVLCNSSNQVDADD